MNEISLLTTLMRDSVYLSREEEVKLFEDYWDEKISKEYIGAKLTRGYIKMINSIALQYRKLTSCRFADLLAEGCAGFVEAIDHYDDIEIKFNTYSAYWVKARITEHIEKNSYFIQLPHNQMVKIKESFKRERKEKIPMPEEHRELIALCTNIVCLDSPVGNPIGDGAPTSYSDIIEDISAKHNFVEMEDGSTKEFLLEKISELLPIEQIIIKVWFGFYEYEITLADLSEKTKYSYSQITIIRDSAIQKLKYLVKKENVAWKEK